MKETINQYIWAYNPRDPNQAKSHWRHYLQIFAVVGRDLVGGMLTLRAMSLVYTTLLSIVPLLAVSISVLKGFGVHDQLEPALVSLLQPLGEKSVEISSRIVGFVENMKIGVLGALGLSLLIFTVITLIQKIESAFNYTWQLNANRNLMQRFSNYLSVVLVGPVLIFSAVGITASLSSNTVMTFVNALPYMNDLLYLVSKVLPYLLVIAAFTFIYILVPNTRVAPRSAFFGAVIAGLLWETSGVIFTSFVGGSTQYTAIYSSFAIMLMFMIWLYLSWLILLVGASIAFYHQHPERLLWRQPDRSLSAHMREQLALQAMVDIGRAFRRAERQPTNIDELAQKQQVPTELLKRMLDALIEKGFLIQSSESPPDYLPACSLDQITLSDILQCARSAEDGKRRDFFAIEDSVASLLRHVNDQINKAVDEQTLDDFLLNNAGEVDFQPNQESEK